MSLGGRLALIAFAVQAVLLTALATVIYGATRNALYDSFDKSLVANAESLASLVDPEEEHDDEDEEAEVELAEEIMGDRFSRQWEPDLFAVYIDGDDLLAKAPRLADVPAFVAEHKGHVGFFGDDHEGLDYRAIVLATFRLPEDDPTRPRPITVYYSASTGELAKQLRSLGMAMGALCLLCVVVSGFLSLLVAHMGLAPLRRLAGSIALIHEHRLRRRLETDGLQPELLPIARSVNSLLGRVERALETERRFSADAAHELRTPVATLKSGIQAALLNPATAGGAKEMYERLLLDVDRLEGLCDALLLVTKSADEIPPAIPAEDWIAEIEAAVTAIRTGSEAGNATFVLEISRKHMPGEPVRSDAVTTYRIAANLAGNALRHGGSDVRVRVSVTFDDIHARLVVEDDGPGIAPDDAANLFKRFFRVESSRARSDGGYGLGLSICKTLAKTQGGNVRFEPNTPRGSRFVWLAAIGGNDAPAEPAGAESAKQIAFGASGLSIP